MNDLQRVLDKMKQAQQRWCADVVEDPEDMFSEYPEFLNWAITILHNHILNESK